VIKTRRKVFFSPDPFDRPKDRVELGTVYADEGFYYNEDWDVGPYERLTPEQQACVRLILSDLQEEDWDNVYELPESVGPHVTFGDHEYVPHRG
jgi:hypothetical protein